MCRLTKKLCSLVLVLCLLVFSAGTCLAAEDQQVTLSMNEYQILKSNFQQWKQDRENLQIQFQTLKNQLEESKKQQNLSSQDWVKLENQLKEALIQLNAAEQKVTLLETQLVAHKEMLANAKKLSTDQEMELASVNRSLTKLKEEIKSERAQAARQKTILEIVAVGALVYAATKWE